MDKEDYNKYEEKIIDVDEVEGTDIKITPAYYIHLALTQCQQAMALDNAQERIYAYRMAVDHLESVCIAAGLTDDDYVEIIKKITQSNDYQNEDKDYKKTFIIAKAKYRELTTRVFKNQTITTPMKM